MLNIFKRPLHKDSLDSWCKMLDDIAKVAILAVPVVLYGTYPISYKVMNVVFLAVCAYSCLLSSDFMRKNKDELTKEKE